MVTVVKERLDKAMSNEGIDIKSFNYATREGMYNSLINGPTTAQDIQDAATLLGCNPDYLKGSDMIVKGTKRKISTICVLGSRIRARIDNSKWTVKSFSAYTGIPNGSISIYAVPNTEHFMSIEVAETIAYGLNCSVEYLIGEASDPTRYVRYSLAEKYKKKRDMVAVNANHIKAYMACNNITFSDLAEAIGFPSYLIKGALQNQHPKFPAPSAKKMEKILNKYMAEKEIASAKRSGSAGKSEPAEKEEVKAEAPKQEEKKPSVYVATASTKPAARHGRPPKKVEPPVEESKVVKLKDHINTVSNDLTRVYNEQRAQKRLDQEAQKELAAKIPEMVKQRKDITLQMSTPSNGMISTGQLLSLAMVTEKKPELLNLFAEITELSETDYNDLIDHIKWIVSVLKRKEN